mmetsp:Transcript_5068/g.10138  ORF Transcript_5068/g.10138 Transcript_5068/m.10138 type:complete len:219 (+) Transcript_5068:83-739(+)
MNLIFSSSMNLKAPECPIKDQGTCRYRSLAPWADEDVVRAFSLSEPGPHARELLRHVCHQLVEKFRLVEVDIVSRTFDCLHPRVGGRPADGTGQEATGGADPATAAVDELDREVGGEVCDALEEGAFGVCEGEAQRLEGTGPSAGGVGVGVVEVVEHGLSRGGVVRRPHHVLPHPVEEPRPPRPQHPQHLDRFEDFKKEGSQRSSAPRALLDFFWIYL